MRKQQIAIVALTLWLTLVSVFMLLAQRIDYEIFVVLYLVGIFVILQFMQSNFVQPGYLRYVKYLAAVGIVMFGLIVAKKVITILAK